MIIGFTLLIFGLILTTLGGFITNDAWSDFTNKNKPNNSNKNVIKNEKDVEAALMYQTQISLFYHKFKTCLNWTLPIKENIDKNVDKVFNYGPNYVQPVNFENLTPEIASKIFTSYNFKNVMANYSGTKDFHPTGYNNLLGILENLKSELEKILFKYGSTMNSNLSSRIDYSIKMTESVITSIRIDVKSKKITDKNSADIIANHLVLLKDDFLLMKKEYTNNIEGGFPIMVGKVEKVDKENGSIRIETQFSGY
ncbi:hypothetical protein C3L50_04860 [Flavobacterium alvei]|uniref:Uncharacterized protein n=2 Tax=Flavobacterium alvei TaxID=2080416 RepID=A0A2S5AE20_9FLAO|nr:hypothetical protein C3L50_04860 [Flavobacterium alvei]